MARKRHTAEEIVAKLRQVDVLMAQGRQVGDAVRAIRPFHQFQTNRADTCRTWLTDSDWAGTTFGILGKRNAGRMPPWCTHNKSRASMRMTTSIMGRLFA